MPQNLSVLRSDVLPELSPNMLSYEQALAIIETNVVPLVPTEVRAAHALGWVSASSLSCDSSVPPFDNSAMDGFAVRSHDTAAAGNTSPVRLRVTGTVLAGDNRSTTATEASAHEIMTGAPVPAGYDAVIPVERVRIERDTDGKPVIIEITESITTGSNLRRAGEDFVAGSPLLSAGQIIGPNQIMGLAATGVERFSARRRPVAAAITTGNELTDAGELQPGMIHDSNGPYLGAAIPTTGADCIGVHRIGDSDRELIDKIVGLQDQVDLVITTGGVSAGRMDFVPRALELMGADILFHRVAIRPGKPALFARLPDGTWFFGLPGNPIAVAVGLRFFVTPALRLLQGLPPEKYRMARIKETVHKKQGLTFFAKARASTTEDGRLEVEVLPGQESFKIKPLMEANCWAMVPAESGNVQSGTTVPVAGSTVD
jgi:molybdopterin molybdotransferase